MTDAESRMSISKPCCFSLSIHGDGVGEDGAAAVGIATAFHRWAAEEIDGVAELLLKILLQSSHFKESRVCLRQELDEKIKVAVGACFSGGARTK